jgi:antitoxin YefM
MVIQTTYSEAREHLAAYMDRATEDREKVIIRRRGRPDVALIAADELASLEETAYLLRSPENARRLFEGLGQAVRGEGVVATAADLDALEAEIGALAQSGSGGIPPTLERLIRQATGRGSPGA